MEFPTFLSHFWLQVTNNLTQAIEPEQIVPAIVENTEKIGDVGTTAVAGIGGVATLGGTLITQFLNTRKKERNIEEYVSETDKLIFENVRDDYQDFTDFCAIEKEIQDLATFPENQTKSYFQLLNIIYDVSTGETYGQRRARFLLAIQHYNKVYYQTSSNDPLIKCPNPNNKIAKQMTEIKKFSTDKN